MNAHLVAREALPRDIHDRMFAILRENFSHVSLQSFDHDLSEKNWVILIRDDHSVIVGFSTLQLYTTTFEQQPIAVVFSGDTIIERSAWGSAALPRTWIQSVWSLHQQECPSLPLYWLLLTGGYRTYRFLSVFWREFYPSWRSQTPDHLQRLLNDLASRRFGERFDPATGLVHLGQPLCDELLPVPVGKRADPDVAFFLKHNPTYAQGDELACIAQLSRNNLTAAGRRMVEPLPLAPSALGA